MKAKKVYEFINPKTDKYSLEDTIPLGPKVLKKQRIEDKLKLFDYDLNDIDVEIRENIIYLKFNIYIGILSMYNLSEYFEDEPLLIENKNRTKFWLKHGMKHREDGPAVEYSDGTKSWHLNGNLHREDGPAVEYCDGNKAWYLNGKQYYSEEAYNEIIKTL